MPGLDFITRFQRLNSGHSPNSVLHIIDNCIVYTIINCTEHNQVLAKIARLPA